MAVLHIIAGVLTGALIGMGVGGGGIAVLYLTAITSIAQADAQAVNLFLYTAAGVSALSLHCHSMANSVSRRDLVLLGITALSGIIFALPGCLLSSFLSNACLRRIFGGVMAASAIPILLKRG